MSNPQEDLTGDALIRALRSEIGDLHTQIKGIKATADLRYTHTTAILNGIYRAIKGNQFRDFMNPTSKPSNALEQYEWIVEAEKWDEEQKKGKGPKEASEEGSQIAEWSLPLSTTPRQIPRATPSHSEIVPPPKDLGEEEVKTPIWAKEERTTPSAPPRTTVAPITTPPTPSPAPTVKPPKIGTEPKKYDGKEKGVQAKNWLRKVWTYTKLNEFYYDKEEKVVMLAIGLLKDSAEAWAAPIVEVFMDNDPTCDELHNAKEFEKSFIRAFSDPDAKRASERKIQELSQGSGKASEYVTTFETLQHEIGSGWGEEAFISHFRKGLRPEILTTLASLPPVMQPQGLRALQEYTVTMDNQLHKFEASQKKTQGGGRKSEQPKSTGRTQSGKTPKEGDANWVSKEEIERQKAAGLCIKCAEEGHRAWKCRNGWCAVLSPTKLKEEDKKKEEPKSKKASVAQVEELDESGKE